MKYFFFYDETEHSRKINYQTVTAKNYYDNFITVIVGWKAEEDECISDRYLAFESKYAYRKKDGELKSQTMKAKECVFLEKNESLSMDDFKLKSWR